ncbi:unnamed protein product, partial [Brassica rapa subsp. narinosa]
MGSGYYQRRMDWRFSISNQGWHTIRKIGVIGEYDLISIILKMKSNVFKGNIGIGSVGICWLMETIFWIFCFIEKVRYEIQWCFVVEFQKGNHGFDIMKEYLPNIRLAKWISYKRRKGLVQVVVDAFKELCFETTIDFKGGEFYASEEALVSLRYEKLFGFCEFCSSLCHKTEKCPLDPKNTKTSPEKTREMKDGNGGWHEVGQHDDRARSYKGVVINGSSNQPNRERESRAYHGKGKGKVADDHKW